MSYVHRSTRRWTIFYYDLRPAGTRRHMTVGDALRHLKNITRWKIYFSRCEVRGLYPTFKEPSRTGKGWDAGDTSQLMAFSAKEDIREAKLDLVEEILLGGMEYYRGLPDDVFDAQIDILKAALNAKHEGRTADVDPLVPRLQARFQQFFRTHSEELRCNLGLDLACLPDKRKVGRYG